MIDTYFTTAPQIDQAYCLGILAGSANLKRDNTITISVPASGREILEFLRDQFEITKRLSVSLRDNLIIMELKSNEMCRDLRRYGFHTTDKFHIQTEWPSKITFHEDQFIRGYFDVCGAVTHIVNKRYNLDYPQWKLLGYDSMLVAIQELLKRYIRSDLSFLGPAVDDGDLFSSIRAYGSTARDVLWFTHQQKLT